MVFDGLDADIAVARASHLKLRGYLRDGATLSALDGAYNALKSPKRLVVGDPSASVDQQCESLENLITNLHRVRDLLVSIQRRALRTAGLGDYRVDKAIDALQESPSFVYFDHFTNAVKHTTYIRRGSVDGLVYFDDFTFKDHGQVVQEPQWTSAQIIAAAGEVIRLASGVMEALSVALAASIPFDAKYSQLCATPVTEPGTFTRKKTDDDC